MLKIKPSVRLNRRYLLISGTKEEIERAILDYIGILGWARAAPLFVSSSNGKTVLAVAREELTNVRAGFALQDKVKILRVSGTLKGLEK